MAIKEIERKITKIGNSLGVTLPKEVLEHIKISQGDNVTFKLEGDGQVTIKKEEKIDMSGIKEIDQDFVDGLNNLFDNYDDALKNLADR